MDSKANDIQELLDERDELRQMVNSYDSPMPGVEERLAELNEIIENRDNNQERQIRI